MLYSAFGVSVGSIVGGYAMNKYGSRAMYIYAASMVGVTLMLHIIGSIGSRLLFNGSSLLPDFPHTVEDDFIGGEETEALFEQEVEPLATRSIDVSSSTPESQA